MMKTVRRHAAGRVIGACVLVTALGMVTTPASPVVAGEVEILSIPAPDKFFPDNAGGGGTPFGGAVAISGDTYVVGASNDTTLGAAAGAVYVYTLDGTESTNVVKLTASDGGAQARFGESVAVAGTRIVVGAPGDDAQHGAAYLFDPDGAGGYIETKLTIFGGDTSRLFGRAVAAFGGSVVATGYQTEIGTEPVATAFVYEPNAPGDFREVRLIPSSAPNISFGVSAA